MTAASASCPLAGKMRTWDGWRTQVMTRLPRCAPSAWHRPTVVVLGGRGEGGLVRGWSLQGSRRMQSTVAVFPLLPRTRH